MSGIAALRVRGTAADVRLVCQVHSAARDAVDCYVFERGDAAGFVIVGADDVAPSVWGYSDSGRWDMADLPDAARWWLEQYQQQLEYLRTHPAAQPRRTVTLTTSVEPLTTTTWSQNAPYNEECPTYRTARGSKKPPAGCVAIAMAQVMKVHNWPPTGTGSNSYQLNLDARNPSSLTTLSRDFSQSTYDWASMKDSYSSSAMNAGAVARLVADVGIAVNMIYGETMSGAQIYDAMRALRTYFRYDGATDLYLRDFYTLDQWEQMLRDELDASRPVIYGGNTPTGGGHAFVFDGYDMSGYFHVNWGWAGKSDGYFACSLLNPSNQGTGSFSGGYNSWQQAVLGIQPDCGGTATTRPLTGYMVNFNTLVTTAAVGADVNVNLEGVTFLGEGSLDSPQWGLQILTADESAAVSTQMLVDATGTEIGVTYSADDDAAFTVPAGIAEGVYHLRAVYTLDGGVTVTRFERPAEAPKYIKMTVEGTTVTFADGDIDDPDVPQPDIAGDLDADGAVSIVDLNIFINILLGNDQAATYGDRADVNGDGEVDAADLNAIVDIILGR